MKQISNFHCMINMIKETKAVAIRETNVRRIVYSYTTLFCCS